MLHRDESRHDLAFIAGVVVGAVSGALVTLALTPMSGRETREKLMERMGDLEPVRERAAEVATTAHHLVETGRERAADLVAKSPLPFGEPHDTDTSETDTALSETPSSTATTASASSSASPASTGHGSGEHTQEPAEGARDVVEMTGADGNGQITSTDGSGQRTSGDSSTG